MNNINQALSKAPLSLKYLAFISSIVIGSLVAFPITLWILFSWIVSLLEINKLFKILIILVAFIYATITNIYFYISLLTIDTDGPRTYFVTYFWSLEVIHFAMLTAFVYALYRIIRYKYTPYSFAWAGCYQLAHVLYNGCPITEVQNYLAFRANINGVSNEFWQGAFGSGEEVLIFRIFFGLICIMLLYTGFVQYKKLEIQPKYWVAFWQESKFNKNNFKLKHESAK
jgi:hypothetical protein